MVRLRGIDMLGVEALAARLEAVADPARLRLADITRRCGDGVVWECELGGVVTASKTLGRVSACYRSGWNQALAGAGCSLLRAAAGQQGGWVGGCADAREP